jgi:PHD/YefM family antitoxin component YafN of YafNO toxin-antitoxin module
MRSAKKKATEVSDQQFVVDREGNRKAVILSLDEYERLLEDLHDLAVVAERRDEAGVDLAEVKKRLLSDGLL